jgi:hypothetical protein
MFRPIHLALLVIAAALVGCGGGPPSDVIQAEIKQAVYNGNSAMYNANKDNADVVAIKVGPWEKESLGGATLYNASWTAKLRFKEPVAVILAEIDGKNLVQVVAEKGEELPFEGNCGGGKMNGKWDVGAHAKGDLMGAGAWKPIYDKVEGLTMGYPVISNGMQNGAKFRTQNFQPLASLKPYIIEGSDEHKKYQAELMEKAKKNQEAYEARQKQAQLDAAERQRKQQEEQARLQAEAAEKQRHAQEEYQRKQAEAAEQQRLAREAAQKKAEEQRHAQLLAVLKPFESATGAVITAEAGPTLGTIILDASIDDPKLTVSGHAIDLREMPFKEFTFDGSVDPRGAFTYKSSLGGDPIAYGLSGEKLASRAGFTIAALADADRAKMESLVATGKRLGSATPITLTVETIDAEAAKTREPQLKLTGLPGSVIYRGRLDARVNPLFAADMASNRAYAWKNSEVVALRLPEPVKGTGIFIRGTAAPSTEMIVTINGVHKVTISSIPKLGDVIINLPPDLELMDIRFQATGSVTARTIGLVK